jgi:hypothetical protein
VIAGAHDAAGLDPSTVDFYLPTQGRLRGRAAGFKKTRGPKPFVDSDLFQ